MSAQGKVIEATGLASAIRIEALNKSYPGPEGPQPVLRDLSLDVAQGESVAILGVSGTGKSTLLNIIGGIDAPDSGSVCVDGDDIGSFNSNRLADYRARKVGFIFQFYNLIAALTAFENVLTALQANGSTSAADERRCIDMLHAVGLTEKQDKFPSQLSGGEQQRVAIARALVKDSAIVLADEPTGNLDPHTAETVMELLVNVTRAAGASLVMVTHDPHMRTFVDRIYALRDGRLERG
ncbi:MAG TPA: ABC transporter ATP-binding protein [Gammaproteobacteria bacterium]|nr:ABC transporter ATP-binding protein [Gammaproteobacteria bacterium]